jgi:hypothetical protein
MTDTPGTLAERLADRRLFIGHTLACSVNYLVEGDCDCGRDELRDAIVAALREAEAVALADDVDAREELLVWFHESTEICEHDYPDERDWPCAIMASHLLRAFAIKPRMTVHPDGSVSFEGHHFHRLAEYARLALAAGEHFDLTCRTCQ